MILSRKGTAAALLQALVALTSMSATVGVVASPEPPKPSAQTPESPRSPRLSELSRALAKHDAHAVDAFWDEMRKKGTPLMEPLGEGTMLVTFVVRATGAPDERTPGIYGQIGDTHGPMPVTAPCSRLEGSDVWYRTYEMSEQARFAYHVSRPRGDHDDPAAVGGFPDHGVARELYVDPLNPKTYVNGWMKRIDATTWIEDAPVKGSYAEGPHALRDPYSTERAGVRRGTVTTHDVASKVLDNERKVTVYTPPGQERGCGDCDFLLLFDRAAYISAVPTPTILDNMQADGVLRPIVAVLVGNTEKPGRGAELPPNPAFQKFIREELMPWLRERYQFSSDPRRAVVAGSSFGGLAATYTALNNSDVFGNVLSQSGSYWWWPEWLASGIVLTDESGTLIRQYRDTPTLPLRFYMEVGTWEGDVMLVPNREFRDVLRGKGYDVQYEERVGGHDYVRWRDSLSEGLRRLLGK